MERLESVEQVKVLDQKSKTKYLLPSKFSFTQINDFKCPRLYYYRYILKVPLKGSHHFSFGLTLHLVLQKFYEEVKRRQISKQGNLFDQSKLSKKKSIKELITLEELIKLYEQNFIDDWYLSKEEKDGYFKQGKESLKLFYNSPYLKESQPSYLEKAFNIKVGDYTLTGKIDRIDEVEGGWKIIDYKTGKPKEEKNLEKEDKEQLLIYQMAMSSLLGGKVKELAYYYLRNDSQAEFLGTEKQIKDLQDKIIKVIGEIENCDFETEIKAHEKCEKCEDII